MENVVILNYNVFKLLNFTQKIEELFTIISPAILKWIDQYLNKFFLLQPFWYLFKLLIIQQKPPFWIELELYHQWSYPKKKCENPTPKHSFIHLSINEYIAKHTPFAIEVVFHYRYFGQLLGPLHNQPNSKSQPQKEQWSL